ncbi:MAG: hypothetical protein PUH68_09175 [Bacteroidales bacterium]|nr:hypothetical protein [Bacteroidales bacterium]MDD7160512.1 hypothetical protein [Bacteroidales bacterium]
MKKEQALFHDVGKVFDTSCDAWGRQTVTLNTINLRRGYYGT